MNQRTAIALALACLAFACTVATNPICLQHCAASANKAEAASAPSLGASR